MAGLSSEIIVVTPLPLKISKSFFRGNGPVITLASPSRCVIGERANHTMKLSGRVRINQATVPQSDSIKSKTKVTTILRSMISSGYKLVFVVFEPKPTRVITPHSRRLKQASSNALTLMKVRYCLKPIFSITPNTINTSTSCQRV